MFGSADGCEHGSVAYYKSSGVEEALTSKQTKYVLKYPVLSSVIAYTAAAAQGRLIINTGHGNSFTIDQKLGTLGYRTEF